MRRAVLGLLLFAILLPQPAEAAATAMDVEVAANGHYEVRSHAPEYVFAGDVGQPLAATRDTTGQDALGAFHEIDFDYGSRTSGVRVYQDKPVAVFTTTYLVGGPNTDPFPTLTSLPDLPYKLSYHDTPFSPYQLNTLTDAADSPWLFFDASGSGFLISALSDFPVARLTLSSDRSVSSGIDPSVDTLPAGFTHQTIIVAGTGINALFDTWGRALTALHGKTRPPNDADLTLEKLGYWTDNGAVYYYHFEPQLGYEGTLLSVTRELAQRGIALGYLQLDSWWYPKGPDARWDDREHGIFRYRAAADLFPDGVAAFQQQVGLPLVTHARWIDPSSPYRREFGFSGNVMTDARYWDDLMSYLHASNVVTYEQDWLGAQAQPIYDLAAPGQFIGNMARAAADRGMTLQFCMPLPRHVLQTVDFNNITTMRVSDDRFERNRWDSFLYTSRLASALGIWPWADVFMSTERNNLLLATLSGGVVGFGDALGAEDADNLRHVARADAVLVKPDAPLVPTDESILQEAAQGAGTPMVAWTFSDHDSLRDLYVFAYARADAPQMASFAPALLGVSGPAYVYDVFADSGHLLSAGDRFTDTVSGGSYYLVAPVGPSGIAFLGDKGQFASLGRKRISRLADDGTLRATIEFATGEQSVILHGYSPTPPAAVANGGSILDMSYDAQTQRFRAVVAPDTTPSSVSVDFTRP